MHKINKMDILNIWLKFLNRNKNKVYGRQKSISRITSSDIVALFDDSNDPTLKVSDLHLTDRTFKLVDINYLKGFLKENSVSERKYITEQHDCDDFSYILQGDITRWDPDLAFGIIHGKTLEGYAHAWNICIGTDKCVWFIEPQTDRVWRPREDYKIWLVVM